MEFFILYFSFIIFVRTFSYGLYELKNNKNKVGGITVIFTAIVILLLPNIVMYLN